jgi:osmoprotectant transport system ATP-binding protein
MDEPFGAVDAIVRQSLQDETLRIHRMLGTTILFVTHDVVEALRLADRIVVLKDGRVEHYDTPLRVLARPATPYVAALLDAKDAVRRLQLLRARDALGREPAPPGAPRVAPETSLREVLSTLLEGTPRVAVGDEERILGSISFADIRDALARTEA